MVEGFDWQLARRCAVPTFVLLTRLTPDTAWTPEALEALQREAMLRLQDDGAEVGWINDCVVFGPYDHLDVFHVPNVGAAAQAATLVLVYGRVSRPLAG
jgi:uncharacterized protein with GYD domain